MKGKNIVPYSILIIALSIAYYFVIFLPQNINQDKKEKELKSLQLKKCIQQVELNSSDFWDKNCKQKGLEKDCGLPQDTADRIDELLQKDKETCFNLYST